MRRPKLEQQDAFAAVIRVAEVLGYAPTMAEYNRLRTDGEPTATAIQTRWGWSPTLTAAGCVSRTEARDTAAVAAYRDNRTLRQIAEEVGLTGEGVRRVISRTMPPEEQRSISAANRHRRRPRPFDVKKALRLYDQGYTLDEIADTVGGSARRIRAAVEDARGAYVTVNPSRGVDPGDLVDAMRGIAGRSERLTPSMWERNRPPGMPGAQAVGAVFGTWSAALEAAGLRRASGRVYQSISRDECVEVMARFVSEIGDDPPTVQRYLEWRERTDAPCVAIVRRRIGLWRQCVSAGVDSSR